MTNRGSYDDFIEAVAQRESGGNDQLVNGRFVGRWQLSEELVGDFASARTEFDVYSDTDYQDGVFDGRWTGAFGIDSLQDFLDNRAVQEGIFRAYLDEISSALTSSGLIGWAGQTLNGDRITETGLLAAAYLIGVPALADWLDAADKGNVPRDGFGTPVTEYLSIFSGYDLPNGVVANQGGTGMPETFSGTDGSDILRGAGGRDELDGRGGWDVAVYDGPADDYAISRVFNGSLVVTPLRNRSEGPDTLRNIEQLSFADEMLTIADIVFGPDGVFRPGDRVDELRGGDGPDRLIGTAGRDRLLGLGGDDTLAGRGGDDELLGGAGRDRLTGDRGDDTLQGDAGDDTLDGGAGDDVARGRAGDDLLRGGSGGDTLRGGDDDDVLSGRTGNDRLHGDRGADTLIGGRGDDTLNGGPGSDTFVFGESFGSDKIVDFRPDRDIVDLREVPGLQRFADLVLSAEQGSALLVTDEGEIRFVGIDPSALGPQNILV